MKSCCEPGFDGELKLRGSAFGRNLRAAGRGLILAGMFVGASLELVIRRPQTRQARAAWLSRFCARVLRRMGVTWTVSGPVPQQGAVISNHLSYMDILLHAAMRPCVFVSKIEMQKVPVLGWMTKMSGTVYVARGAGGSAAKAGQGMQAAFDDGLPVVFFPEGTTGIGDELMPFHSGLLAQALEADAPVTPGLIAYSLGERDIDDGRTLRQHVHWGPQTLGAHLWSFLSMHDVSARVDFASYPIAFSGPARADRKIAAVEAHAAVAALVAKEPASTYKLAPTASDAIA
jgi:1-acyl-sn-glycerol-3-phosphate acyltransferase